ncbi:substrate-binding domain-containing protein [Corynebacterium sanguinis]|uniref:substrate-binding domain-containing protein n=1 Tax=Corynebacterium sanguinis TaxID=2594913 RepID=UPI00264EB6DE|nr:substrate-binding domain-containing protein [Corynebacterium sanguinis]MDN8621891.1 substrate-binding domain-containing protein [Corynebacterium sanguinis]
MKRLTLCLAATVALAGCAAESEEPNTPAADGAIRVTGSATVEPITSLIASRTGHNVEISADGSTDGFEAFCAGESDINDSSVPIPGEGEDIDYQTQCADNGVEFIELPIALDAITFVKNDANDWASDLTIEQLHDIWTSESPVSTWSDLNPQWPESEITLYGRPPGSGTLGVFQKIVLDDDPIRDDYAATDDMDELTEWIANDPDALGFMGVGNYLAAEGEVRSSMDNIAVDGTLPSFEQTRDGQYPLSRPLFLYVNVESLDKPEVDSFVTEYLDRVEAVLPRVFFYPLPEQEYDAARERLKSRTMGTDDRWTS